MNEVTRHFCWHRNFAPWGLAASVLGLYTCVKSWKKCIKSDFKEKILKLATNNRSDKMFLLTSKFRPQGVVSPCPGAIYIYKIMKKKKMSKIRLQRDFLKLVAKDRSDKRFLLTSNVCPLGLSAPDLWLYTFIKSWQDVCKVRGWRDSV